MTDLGVKIWKLRGQGKSYSEIAKTLNCSKSTVCYYCGKDQKQKKLNYQKNIVDQNIRSLCKRINNFKSRKIRNKKRFKCKDYKASFRTRVSNFVNNWKQHTMKNVNKFGYKEVLEYIGGWETKCYLTGRPIDLRKDNYELDHVVPIAKGGSCELNNLKVVCKDANQSKHDMLLEDYLQLCKEVLENFGYTVEKK